MRPPALAVALAICCVLAGCNAFAPGSTSSPGDAPTVTPADVPRDPEDGTLAPGLSEAGLVDRSALFRAHRSHFQDRAVRVERRFAETYEGDVTANVTRTTVVGPDRTRMVVESTLVGSVTTPLTGTGYYTNGSVSLERRVVGETVRYTPSPEDGPTPRGAVQQRLETFRDVLYRIDVRSVERVGERDGRPLYRVTAADPQTREYPDESGTANVLPDVTLTLDERGVVHSIRTVADERRPASATNVDSDDPNEQVTVTVVQTTTFTGNATVATPDWVREGFERVSNREYLAPGVTDDGVVGVRQLRGGHEAVVENASVRFEQRTTRDERGTTVTERREVGRIDRASGRQYLVEEYVSRNETHETWGNDTVGYRQLARDDDVEYDRLDAVSLVRSSVPRFPQHVALAETTVTPLDDGRYRVVATDVPTAAYYPSRYERVTFVVDDRGFVSSYEATIVRKYENRSETRTFTAETGETTVPRPDWLDDARNETGRG